MKLENTGRYKGVRGSKHAYERLGDYHWREKLRGLSRTIREYRRKVAKLQHQIKWASQEASRKKVRHAFDPETGTFKRVLPPCAHLARYRSALYDNEFQLAAMEKEFRIVEAQFKQWKDLQSFRETSALLHCNTATLKRHVRADARKAGIEKIKI